MLLNFKEFTALHSGGCLNTYFKTKRSGENDKVRIKRV